jgi:hypothetical protein
VLHLRPRQQDVRGSWPCVSWVDRADIRCDILSGLVQDVAEVILRASVWVLNGQTRLLASSEKVLLRVLVGVIVVTVLVVLEVTESANHIGLVGGWRTVG